MGDSTAAYLVIGASGSIGAATARRLAASGARVALAARSSDRLLELASELDAPCFEIDPTEIGEVEEAFGAAAEQLGGLTGAVNCVGSLMLKPAHLTSADDWADTLRINLTSAFAVVRGAAQTMRRSGGSVVLISSAAARHGFANHEAIAAAKAGVIGLTTSAAATYAPFGLRFNAVAPGLVRTRMTEQIWSKDASRAASEAMHAVGRLGEPDDIASAIAWLLAPENSWLTGEVLTVDGGLSTVRTAARKKPS
ncbi:3-oxoacyl-[acyl-carrier-protein] reductase FabG [Posidoniimonas polymericola]|uniref:3-oxoacyl-[acyl-carrier-protein] reductase FabG n=1 Tax=Posidoniimonas polymericola TaxID=2528002 RepID=A0A5C5YMV4_9BACT|nr:SDR family oxidoreductase [Posidoniimonas polymericola]TWT76118.1 3-oxoacyl-[acyl-carrier-protein] reductase FabG [Posidoniimonas polymericola]